MWQKNRSTSSEAPRSARRASSRPAPARGPRQRVALGALRAGLALVLAAGCTPAPEPLPPGLARRHVALSGAANFRDLGGYRTGDGRNVRWGQLYRSDALAELTDEDVETLRGLDIRLVCDLRSPKERERAPDRLPGGADAPKVALLPVADARFDPDEMRERLLAGDETLDTAQLLVDGNEAFATTFSTQYRALLERIAVPANRPALVHCTAGKDRAGFAAAVLLRTLGVPEETVFEDYLATNRYTAHQTERTLQMIRFASLFRADPERVRPIFEARREYLQAAFDAIRAEYGSFDAYLEQALGVDAEERKALQEQLLE